MIVKAVVDERFEDYKVPCLLVAAANCDWKCCDEAGLPHSVCQNNPIATKKGYWVWANEIAESYFNNPITQAVCFAGLEPMLQIEEMLDVIKEFRETRQCHDDIVIYTGYTEGEISWQLKLLCNYDNIVVKFGRYVPGQTPHYDPVLGVFLASDGQYAKKIS